MSQQRLFASATMDPATLRDRGPFLSPPRDILTWLIRNHGSKVGVTEENFPRRAGESGISSRHARRWLRGDVARLTSHSKKQLAALFRPGLPHLRPEFFDCPTAHEFAAKLKERPAHDVHILLPAMSEVVGPPDIGAARDQLHGFWLLYQFAFDNTGALCQEIVNVFEQDGLLRFRWHFRARATHAQGTLFHADGQVLPIGDSYAMIGLDGLAPKTHARLRMLMLRQTAPHAILGYHRFGILTSVSPVTREPCAARVLMRRVSAPQSEEDFVTENARFISRRQLARIFSSKRAEAVLDMISNARSAQRRDFVLTTETNEFTRRLFDLSRDIWPSDE